MTTTRFEFDNLTAADIDTMAANAEQRAAATAGEISRDYAREARKCRRAATDLRECEDRVRAAERRIRWTGSL